jgi:multidrug efflux pump subunit AcrA (membrane-fusion protein)
VSVGPPCRPLRMERGRCPGAAVEIAVGIAIAMLSSCQERTKAAEDRPPTPVRAVPVKMFTPQSGERYSASLAPAQELTLSFRVGGMVESVDRLQPGDSVAPGAVLATLRPLDYDLQIQQAKAQLESARRNIEVARSALAETEAVYSKADAAWKRASALYESRALTAPDFEAAKAQRDATAAQVSSTRSQIEGATAQESSATAALSSAELAKTDSALISPWAARLIKRSIEVGSLVSPGQPAFLLADISSVKVVFGVADSSLAGLKRSERIAVAVESVPGRFSGVVTSIAAAADPATRLFLIEATVPNAAGNLRPGMIATVYLRSSGPEEPVALVPLSSIIRAKGEAPGFCVMVVRANQVGSRTVKLGATYGDQIVVTGLDPGEMVVASGASLLAEGEHVEVIQ